MIMPMVVIFLDIFSMNPLWDGRVISLNWNELSVGIRRTHALAFLTVMLAMAQI
jgi:hypothetical protein